MGTTRLHAYLVMNVVLVFELNIRQAQKSFHENNDYPVIIK